MPQICFFVQKCPRCVAIVKLIEDTPLFPRSLRIVSLCQALRKATHRHNDYTNPGTNGKDTLIDGLIDGIRLYRTEIISTKV